jgi:hypothetical protein
MATREVTKADLLRAIETEQDWWRAVFDLAAADGPLTGDESLDGAWTYKELLAHVLGWRRLTLARLEAAATNSGKPAPPWPDGMSDETAMGTDEINAWFQAESREQSLDQVIGGMTANLDGLHDVVEQMPAADLLTPGKYPWLGEGFDSLPVGPALIGYSITHVHVDHAPTLEAWLTARQGQHVELPPTPSNLGYDE